ncbi:MAG: hypothetical protein MUC49_03205 [Raineya sp.]|jgi:predicted HTH transcriptional regulator|nr:hypothetical protein [Raineya sp.]
MDHDFHFIGIGIAVAIAVFIANRRKNKQAKEQQPSKSTFELTDEMIMRFANLKGGIISAQELSSQTSLNKQQAQQRLENLVNNGYAQLRVSDNGNILYDFKQNMIDNNEKKNSQLL